MLAVATSTQDDAIIQLKNIESKYKNFKCGINSIKIEPPAAGCYPQWYNYLLCGIKGILDYVAKMGDYRRKGFMIAVSGNIPPASGLSSSSALVCAAALSTAFIYDLPLNKQLLATLSASSERFIGTQGGGMDQAIAFLAKKGCAQFIEFNPVRATSIQLPTDAVFVIANCLSEANKAATSDFNQRVVECRIACKLIAKCMGLAWQEVDKLAQLQSIIDVSLETMESLVKLHLNKELYERTELMDIFEISSDEFEDLLLTQNTRKATDFKLRQRALHVIQESIRVEQFREIANNLDDENEDDAVEKISQLMSLSHQSLKALYDCSHPNLDELVNISKMFNVGARLTGAGWGGCIVALTDSISSCDQYINGLRKSYYDNISHSKNDDEVVFATEPQNGAEVFIAEFS